MNYENPLAEPTVTNEEGLSGMEMAGLGALTLGGGIAGKKVYNKAKEEIKSAKQFGHDASNALKATWLGRLIAEGKQGVNNARNKIAEDISEIDRLNALVKNSRIQSLANNNIALKNIDNRVSDNIFNFAPENLGVTGTGEVSLPRKTTADLLRKTIQLALTPELLKYKPVHLSTKDLNVLGKQWKNLTEGDRLAGLYFADKAKGKVGKYNDTDIEDWSGLTSLFSGTLNLS